MVNKQLFISLSTTDYIIYFIWWCGAVVEVNEHSRFNYKCLLHATLMCEVSYK